MRVVIVTHKRCWYQRAPMAVAHSDGGFPFQIQALTELFDETRLLAPCIPGSPGQGAVPLRGKHLTVVPLRELDARDGARKLAFIGWFFRNGVALFREIAAADAVHAPLPGDVGTLGMLIAVALRRPLFVRHCGNWLKPATVTERFLKWFMEKVGGGRNVMLATGGGADGPSSRNRTLQWIFSTALTRDEIAMLGSDRQMPAVGSARLIIACRQELEKGTGRVIEAVSLLRRRLGVVTLDVVGDGIHLQKFKEQARSLALADHVRFHGNVDHQSLLRLLQGADLFCFPTRASEGFPKVVLEALACGLPVVTTRISVLPHLLESGGGVVLNDDSPQGIADAVLSCLSSASLYREMSVQARLTAQRFSLEHWRDTIGRSLSSAWGPLRRHA